MSNIFRSIALRLRGTITDTYALLEAADLLVGLVEDEKAASYAEGQAAAVRPVVKSPDGHATWVYNDNYVEGGHWSFDHDYLVNQCLANDAVLMYVGQTKKINAIKELRRMVPGSSLRETKIAVEDSRVTTAAALRSDPWAVPPSEDEPPF